MKQIKFKNKCTAQGRNGVSICTGITIYPTHRIDENNVVFNVIDLSPINSRNEMTNCWIELEMDKVPDIIKGLQYFYDEYTKTKRIQRSSGNKSKST